MKTLSLIIFLLAAFSAQGQDTYCIKLRDTIYIQREAMIIDTTNSKRNFLRGCVYEMVQIDRVVQEKKEMLHSAFQKDVYLVVREKETLLAYLDMNKNRLPWWGFTYIIEPKKDNQ